VERGAGGSPVRAPRAPLERAALPPPFPLQRAAAHLKSTDIQVRLLDPARAAMGHYANIFDAAKADAAMRSDSLQQLVDRLLAKERAALAAETAAAQALADAEAVEKSAAAAAAASAAVPKQPGRFVETSGGKLQQDGVVAFESMVQALLSATPPGGVIFIDEAPQLVDNDVKGTGRDVVKRLIKYSEDHRKELTFLLAGYPDTMEVGEYTRSLSTYSHALPPPTLAETDGG